MTLLLKDIITAARDADAAFAKQRVPDAVFARFLSRYQKRLVGKATEIRPGVITAQVSIVFPAAPGLPSVSPVSSIGAGTGSGLPIIPTVGQQAALGSTGYSATPEVVGNIAELDLVNAPTLFGPAVASATTTTTLTAGGSPNWNPSQYADGQSYVQCIAGTDVRDVRLIIANDTQTLTVNAPFTVTPDLTTIWRIIRVTAVVNQEMSTVLSMPATSQRSGYAVKFDASGNPYIDLTTPLIGFLAEGIPLPPYKSLLDGTIYFQTSLVYGEQDLMDLTIVDASHRLRAQGRYNAYERNGQLFLIGNANDWGLVQSIDLRYVPEPSNLTALDDAFVLPDSAYDALVSQAARFAAERVYNAPDTPNVDVDAYRAAAAEAELEWLQELGARYRASTSNVKETWSVLAVLGLGTALLVGGAARTASAAPTRLDPIHVVAAQRVAPLAVSLASVAGGRSDAAEYVLACRDRLHVPRVDAVPNAANVVDVQAVGDRPAEATVRLAVRESGNAVPRSVPDGDQCIAPPVDGAWPRPARISAEI